MYVNYTPAYVWKFVCDISLKPPALRNITNKCTDPARNDFWELAGGLPVNARSRGRLELYTARPAGARRTHGTVTGPG